MALTDKERIFVDEYIKCWNGAMAARLAGYSAKTARQIAYENLTKPDIRAEIEKRLKDSAMSADEVISRLSTQARGSMDVFIAVNKEGFASLNFSTAEAKAQLHLVKKIKTRRSRRVVGTGRKAEKEQWEDDLVEIEIHDPQKALDMLAKYHQLYAEKGEDGNPITDDERIARVVAILDRARARRDGHTSADASPNVPAGSETSVSSA